MQPRFKQEGYHQETRDDPHARRQENSEIVSYGRKCLVCEGQ
jgi:hypothetical protein